MNIFLTLTWYQCNFHTLVGLMWLQFQQSGKAKSSFNRSIKATPTAAAYSGLGIALLRQQSYPSAIDSFRSALELDPNNEYDAKWLNWTMHLSTHPACVSGCQHC